MDFTIRKFPKFLLTAVSPCDIIVTDEVYARLLRFHCFCGKVNGFS